MPNYRATTERRHAISHMVRNDCIQSQEEMVQKLADTYNVTVHINTLSRDFEVLGIAKDPRSGCYHVVDDRLERSDLYDELKNCLKSIVLGYNINTSGDTIAIYCDMGTERRVASIIEAVRYDENIKQKNHKFYDNILAVIDTNMDSVVVLFKNSGAGLKFRNKLDVLGGSKRELAWVENEFEKEVMERYLSELS